MADFQTSTHKAKWIFTSQLLVEKHKVTNQRAKQMLEKYGTTRMEVDVDGSLSYPEPQVNAADNADKHSRPKLLSVEEEQFMRATALIYFKRFYLQWSVMEHDPKHSLEFDLIVYAPYRSVEGFINDMEELCHATDDQIQMLKDLQATAIAEVDKIMFTDAPLLFPPGQSALAALERIHSVLALAALRIANEMHQVLDFERYLRNILSRQNSVHTISDLIESLDAIDSWVKKYKFPTEKDMKHINRKLKSCWGHGSHDDKKREKKSKHKSHKSSNEMQNGPSLA
ncbi:hypothetical protein GH714_025797 [Hevea brasiliensis]|uniref:Cyclin C-terminal domain-containing protein n=1 Tax=Hevea brasiliensis TaxID=3981 RepID=A0A6A6M0M1_HEVBR|nr:hypothetical protein GH714_025797 [Hevea brasiliensis]